MPPEDPPSAGEEVARWLAGANAIALLQAATKAGLLRRLVVAREEGELARELGVEPTRVARMCQALLAHGVLERADGGYRVRPGFAALEADDAPLTLGEQIAASGALRTALAASLDDAPGWDAVSDEESLALARLAWGRPTSPAALAMWAEVDRQMPEVVEIWEGGGSYAELGCGAGRDLLRVAVMYERARVYGHDIKQHLLDDCRSQAEALGVSERVELVCGDVRHLGDGVAYDTIMWSQMFFPPATRPGALEAIHRLLRPSGYLLMPLMPEVPEAAQTDQSPRSRGLLVARVAYQRWQIHWEPEPVIREELESSGFESVRNIDNPRTPYALFRRA